MRTSPEASPEFAQVAVQRPSRPEKLEEEEEEEEGEQATPEREEKGEKSLLLHEFELRRARLLENELRSSLSPF